MAGQIPYEPYPTVNPQGGPIPDLSTRALGGIPGDKAFGHGMDRTLEESGANLQRAGSDVLQAAIRQQNVLNDAATTDALNQAQDKTTQLLFGNPDNPNDPGYFGLKGKAAIDAYPTVAKQIGQINTDIANGLTNPKARQDFERLSRRMTAASMQEIGRHHSQQVDTYAVNTAKATLEIQSQRAGLYYNDDEQWNHALADAHGALMSAAAVTGASPEEQQADWMKVQSDMATARVLAWSARDPLQANQWLQQNADLFTPDKLVQLQAHLKGPVEDLQSRQALAAALGGQGGTGAPVTTSRPDLQPGQRPPTVTSFNNLWEATKQQESGNRQVGDNGQVVTSSAGAIGISQLMPDTARAEAKLMGIPFSLDRLKNDKDYNESIGRHLMSRLVDKYDGDQTLALAAYNAGEGNVSKWLDANGDPRLGQVSDADWAARIPVDETKNYVASILGNTGPGGPRAFGPTNAPDYDTVADRIYSMHLPPAVEDKALSMWTTQYNRQQRATEGQRSALKQAIEDDAAARASGHDGVVSEQQIRSLLPPVEAEEKIQYLRDMSMLGGALKSANTMSPEQLQEKDREINAFRDQPGTAGYAEHAKVAQIWSEAIKQRNQLIKDDPSLFVQQNDPTVQRAWAAAQATNDPAAQEVYMRASLDAQERLGVQLAKRTVLPDAQAKGIVTEILKAPAQERSTLIHGLENKYGRMWPEVFGALVRQGSLPGEYQVMALIDDPAKSQALAEAIGSEGGKPASDRMDAALAKGHADKKKAIDAGLKDNEGLQQLAASMPFDSASFAKISDGVKLLAYSLAYKGDDHPLDNAVKAITDKYDFDQTGYRFPKGRWDVPAEADRVMDTLDAASLAPLRNTSGTPLAADYIPQVTLDNAKNGQWVTNENDTGLVRIGANHNPVMIVSRGRPMRLEVPFAWSYAEPAAGDIEAQRRATSNRLRLGYEGALR